MESYTWSRTVTTEGGLATGWLQALRGVAPGSAFAVYELKLVLFQYITEVACHPLNTAILHVDDSVIRFTGESIEEVVAAAIDTEERVKKHLAVICMDLSEEKEQILGTSEDIVRQFKKATGRPDKGHDEEAVSLGIDTRLLPRVTRRRVQGGRKATVPM